MWLVLALALLAIWVVAVLVFKVAVGAVHLLVFAAAILMLYQVVRWARRQSGRGPA